MGLRSHLWTAIVPVTCPVHATWLHETDLQSVCPVFFYGFHFLFFCVAPVFAGQRPRSYQ